MGLKGIIAYILFIGVGFNLGVIVFLRRELRFPVFLIMVISLIFALFLAVLEQKDIDKKRHKLLGIIREKSENMWVLEKELDKKREIIAKSKREIKKMLGKK